MINTYILRKTIDNNGCWIPHVKPLKDGYVQVTIDNVRYKLHRLSMCISRGLDYNDKSFETRHNYGCNRACFNPEHLSPGTAKDNTNDMLSARSHVNQQKKVCPTCNKEYATKIVKSGFQTGRIYRFCKYCEHRKKIARRKLR